MKHRAAELSPEVELLILSARQHPTDSQRKRIRELSENKLNWDTVIKRSTALAVQGLLRRNLSAADAPLPPGVADFLEQEYRLQAIANLKRWHQLQEIVDGLDRSDILAVLLKGAFLAFSVYEDPALRPMYDLDLLCRREDWPVTKEVLQSLGYQEYKRAGDLNPFSSHRTFYRPKSVRVEVHFDLDCGLSTEEIVSRSETVLAGGRPLRTLRFQDLVRHLVVHLANHFRSGSLSLIWFADIHEVASRSKACFRESAHLLSQQVGRSPSGPVVWSFLNRYWLDCVPDNLAGWPVSHAEILDQIGGRRTVPVLRYLDPLRKIRNYPGLGQKIRYLRWLFFPPPSYLAKRGQLKPGRNVYLHYLGRSLYLPVRLVQSALAAYRSDSLRDKTSSTSKSGNHH